jgi:hypothetical protein
VLSSAIRLREQIFPDSFSRCLSPITTQCFDFKDGGLIDAYQCR